MKRFLLAIIALTAMWHSTMAASRNTVVMPVQVVQGDSSFKLPSKTDYLELKKVTMADAPEIKAFAEALSAKLAQIEENGAEHYCYALVVWPEGDGVDNLRVDLYDHDILQSSAAARRMAYGDYCVRGTHFIMLMNPDNADFLKKYVKNAGGYTRFERVYEYVPEIIAKHHTMLHATFADGRLTATTYIIDGDDQLKANADGGGSGYGSRQEETVNIPLISVEKDPNKATTSLDSAGIAGIGDHDFMTNPTSGLRLKQIELTDEVAAMAMVKAAMLKLEAIAKAEKVHNTLLLKVGMKDGYPNEMDVTNADVIELSATTHMAGVLKVGGINFVLATTPLTEATIDQAVDDAGTTICFTHVLQVVKQRPASRNTWVTYKWTGGKLQMVRSVIDGHYINIEK